MLNLALFASLLVSQTPRFAWVEGELPTQASAKFESQATNYPSLLSGGKWLQYGGKEDLNLTYRVEAPEGGTYDAQARVGFEWVRSPMQWRVNDGAWTSVGNDVPTTDPTRLSFWTEVGWLPLGKATLRKGENTLELRFTPRDDKQVVVGLDAVAFVPPGTRLEGKFRPGEHPEEAIDREAKGRVFSLPMFDSAGRASVRMDGAWEVARWTDPNPDQSPYERVRELPKDEVQWQGVQVPGDAWAKPELSFANRLVYRTRVEVPAGARGRSFSLHFSGTTWIVSAFVNGKFMGSHRGILVPWDLDITKGIEPGRVNEIAFVVKGPYYGFDTKAMNSTLQKLRNLPREEATLRYARWVAPIYPSSKGEGEGSWVGLVNPVTLVSAGPVYTTDAFVRPSWSQKRLDVDLTLLNPTSETRKLRVVTEALNPKTDAVELTLPEQQVTVEAGQTAHLRTGKQWPNPRLWWPVRDAEMYTLRTTILENGSPIDIHRQPFGFREVTIDGKRIRINGVVRNFWNWVDVATGPKTPQEWLAGYEAGNDRFHRFAYDHRVAGVDPHREAQLAWSDANGVPGRLSTCIDGMFINYDLNNPLVWENFQEHLEQVARAYRNHPSVIVYSAENELMYINAQNTGSADMAEPKMAAIIEAAQKVDPTRPWGVDGGGALVGNRLAIDIPHYPEAETQYQPNDAYTFEHYADHSRRWPWDRYRPLLVGETFFYAGKLEDQAWIGGDEVFRGRQFANVGASKYAQALIEGMRYQEVAGIFPWVAHTSLPGAAKSFSSLAAFPRKRGLRLRSGESTPYTLKVFNDSLDATPVSFSWRLLVNGQEADRGSETLSIEPGLSVEKTISLRAPRVTTRQPAVVELSVSQNGKVGFVDRKEASVLPAVPKIAGSALVWDTSGKIVPWLKARGVRVTDTTAAGLANAKGLLVVGPDTLTAQDTFGSALLGYAAKGNPVVVLEQETPLAGAALPVPVRVTNKVGGYVFSQAPTLPAFRDLGSGDLEDWAGDFPTFKRSYVKPSGGARPLAQAGDGLNLTPLLEVPAGDGVLVLCQLCVGAKLGVEPAADQLLANLVSTYASFRPTQGRAAVLGGETVRKAVERTAVRQSTAQTVTAALAPENRVAVVEASPANLAALNAARSALDKFTARGGWLMLTDLRPEGMAEFNRLTGIDDPIRPFRLERVTLEHPEHPLAATLGNRDLAFYSPQEIMHGDYWLSEHAFSYVVGAADAAPFMRMPGGPEEPLEYKPTFSDNDPYNFVNGLLNSDSWRTIRQLWVPESGELTLDFGLRRPETIRQINVWNNTNYSTIERMDIVFDGDTAGAMHVTLPDNDSLTEFKLEKPRTVAKSIQFVVKSWRRPFQVRDGQTLRLVGIDNVQFLRAETPKGKVALDNVGGLVAYPRGKGGILLNQLKFGVEDPNPANEEKKLRLFTTLLNNLGVGSASHAVVLPGVNAEFTPLDLTRWNNAYIRPAEGRSVNFDLGHLVAGERFYGDVPFLVSDYRNAPVPQAIEREAKGIAVGRKADALYLLHTLRVDRPVQSWERIDAPEVARIIVRYEDGSSAEMPVRLGEEVGHWRSSAPAPVPNGRIAWAVPYPGDLNGERPVVYASQWTNPKPQVAISTIDVAPGKESQRGVYALLGVTLATARK